jgi:hypothetical protein
MRVIEAWDGLVETQPTRVSGYHGNVSVSEENLAMLYGVRPGCLWAQRHCFGEGQRPEEGEGFSKKSKP